MDTGIHQNGNKESAGGNSVQHEGLGSAAIYKRGDVGTETVAAICKRDDGGTETVTKTLINYYKAAILLTVL